MTVEKQIEEMAKIYESARYKASETLGSMNEGEGVWYAKAFYTAGYRKASEIARGIFEEIGERFASLLQMSPAEGKLTDAKTFIEAHWEFIAHSIMFKYDAELKKKYTGGWKKRDCSNCKNRNEEGCSFGNMCITSNSPYATPSHWKAKESEDTE